MHALPFATPAVEQAGTEFTDAEFDGLPETVVRYLQAAIAPQTQLATRATLRMRGQLKLGSRWLPFRARQELTAGGFIWSARVGGLITGWDRYVAGNGELRWALLGLVPVIRASGPDISRSAAGRAGAEAVWLPSCLLPRFGVRWSAQDDRHISAVRRVDATDVALHFTLDGDARPLSVVFDRWGDPGGSGEFGLHQFGMQTSALATFGGFTIPSAGRAGWFYGSDGWEAGEFFRYELLALEPKK